MQTTIQLTAFGLSVDEEEITAHPARPRRHPERPTASRLRALGPGSVRTGQLRHQRREAAGVALRRPLALRAASRSGFDPFRRERGPSELVEVFLGQKRSGGVV